MTIRRNIREQFGVPEGYFENLETRLSSIAVSQDEPVNEAVPVSMWGKFMPYVGLAALFSSAIIGGTFLLNRTGGVTEASAGSLEQLFYADLVPITYDVYQMEEFFTVEEEDEYFMSDEDFIEYMLQSGMTPEMLEQFGY